jgi:hypothetical protein
MRSALVAAATAAVVATHAAPARSDSPAAVDSVMLWATAPTPLAIGGIRLPPDADAPTTMAWHAPPGARAAAAPEWTLSVAWAERSCVGSCLHIVFDADAADGAANGHVAVDVVVSLTPNDDRVVLLDERSLDGKRRRVVLFLHGFRGFTPEDIPFAAPPPPASGHALSERSGGL